MNLLESGFITISSLFRSFVRSLSKAVAGYEW